MHRSSSFRRSIVSLAASLALAAGMSVGVGLVGGSSALGQVGTSVTYQGQLKNNGVAVNSPADVRFSIWDAATGGGQVGTTDTKTGVAVSQGLFSTTFDCGVNPYTADAARWLQIEVRNPSNVGGFVLLGSRQRLTAAPFSLATRGINVPANGEVHALGTFKVPANSAIFTHGGATNNGGRLHIQSGNDGTFDGLYLNPFPNGGNVYLGNGAGAANLICYDKVGIGTGTPLGLLSVGPGSHPDTNLAIQTSTAGAGTSRWVAVNKNGGYGLIMGYDETDPNDRFAAIRQVTGDPLRFMVNNLTTAMTLVNNGNVGIGTNAPTTKLHLLGGRLRVDQSDGVTGSGVLELSNGTSTSAVYTAAGTGDMVLSADVGKSIAFTSAVGIGTSPTHALTVQGNTNTMRLIGPTGSFQWNSRLNLGDADYVRISELDDDFLDLKGANGIRAENTFSAPAKNFRIDHPSDPANMILNHGCIESDQYVNLYRGNAVIGNDGGVWIQLPAWMNDLNTDFSYQLTSVGAAQPNLYVAVEVNNQNQFRVAGGQPGAKVSWQITGVRHDAYVQSNPLVVEEVKQAKDRGTYLSPNSFGVYTAEELAKMGNRK